MALKKKPVTGMKDIPVSYTHLDVYKRQPLPLPVNTSYTRTPCNFPPNPAQWKK